MKLIFCIATFVAAMATAYSEEYAIMGFDLPLSFSSTRS